MKKFTLLLILNLAFIVFNAQKVKAQFVTIPDANFRTWLTQNYPSCMNGNQMDTTCSAIVNATSVNVSNKSISNLSGIHYFVNLQTLDCSNNQLTNLDVSANTALFSLNCNNNQLINLNISANTALTTLNCLVNQLTNLDVSANTALTYLACNGNQLTNLDVAANTALTNLACIGNQLTNLDVSANTALTFLVCSSNQLTNLDVSANTALNSLNCSGNQLTNLNVSANTALFALDCRENQLTNLNVSSNTALTYLYCHGNQLTNLDVSANTALTDLDCRENQLSNIDVSANTNISLLLCSYNQLTNLNVSANTALTFLVCSSNQLTNLDVSANTALNSLNCSENQLTNLNVSANTALTALSCHHNQLSILSLPANTALGILDCSYNQLTSLAQVPDVMDTYKISNNNISCLNNLPQITNGNYNNYWVDITNNPLTCVPNQTPYSLGLPFCIEGDTTNNPNNCQSVVNVLGNVYKDLNNNCQYNNTDLNVQNFPVKIYDTQNNLKQVSYTVNGVYSFSSLPVDTYLVKINDVAIPVDMACSQANNQTVQLDSTNQTISNINFPLVCDSAFDLQVHSLTNIGLVFPGQVHTLITNLINDAFWYNLNCGYNSSSGTVTIDVSGPVTFISPAANALTPIVNDSTFTYNISNFSNITSSSFGLNLLTDTLAQNGNQICVHVSITPNTPDADTTNNEYTFCYNVVNSYDPNMKEVYPTNVLPGYDDWFTYTIHFQNTGTAPAFNIRLRDTIDTQLDINTFEFLGASHAANTSLNGNILTVRFNNIMLPDSTSDYEGSMGYYQYRVKPLPNITNGSTIENTAYIYFDYNPAIITNTTQNNFEMPVGNRVIEKNEAFIAYPNPSTGVFTIKSASVIKTIEVFNLIGESVLQQTNGNTININNQPQGIYFCKVNGSSVVKLVKE